MRKGINCLQTVFLYFIYFQYFLGHFVLYFLNRYAFAYELSLYFSVEMIVRIRCMCMDVHRYVLVYVPSVPDLLSTKREFLNEIISMINPINRFQLTLLWANVIGHKSHSYGRAPLCVRK